jgi:hypothetical protein
MSMKNPEITDFSRRRFLKATATAPGLMAVLDWLNRNSLLAANLPSTTGQFHIDGGLVTLPRKGRLFLTNDLHTRIEDFDRWLKRTRLVEQLRNTEDTYGLILGDVCDEKVGDPEAKKDGDLRIIDKIREMQAGPGGNRLIYILGNHEYEALKIYETLKKQRGLNGTNHAKIMRDLQNEGISASFFGFDFIERMGEEHYEYFKKMPVAVLCANGVMGIHAGPARKLNGAQDITKKAEPVTEDMVWCRPTRPYDHATSIGQVYDSDDVVNFLKLINNSHLMLVGHTPLTSLPADWIRNDLGYVGGNCVVMGASYGSMPGKKQYLSIDLAKDYTGVADLAMGKEILPLIDGNGG